MSRSSLALTRLKGVVPSTTVNDRQVAARSKANEELRALLAAKEFALSVARSVIADLRREIAGLRSHPPNVPAAAPAASSSPGAVWDEVAAVSPKAPSRAYLFSIGDKSELKVAWQLGEQYLDESILGSLIHAAVLRASDRHKDADEAIKGAARAANQAFCLDGLDTKLPVLHELSAAGHSLGHAMAGDMESAAAEWTVHHKNDAVLDALVAGISEKDPKERQRLLEKAGLNLGLATVNVVAAASLAIDPMVGAAARATHPTAAGAAAGFTGLIGSPVAVGTAGLIDLALVGTVSCAAKALRTANTAAPGKATAAKDRIAFGLCLLMVIVSNYVLLRLFGIV
ncbi:hypothetical protein HK405_010277, partial [Cladochytrium tenue]